MASLNPCCHTAAVANLVFFWDSFCAVAANVGAPANGIVAELCVVGDGEERCLTGIVIELGNHNLGGVSIRNAPAAAVAIDVSAVLTLRVGV